MKVFELPIYKDRLKIYVGVGEWAKWHKDGVKANMLPAELAKSDVASCYENLIWLRDFKKSPKWISTLAHELCHFMAWFGEFHGIDDEEAYAYLFEYILRTILEQGVR